MEREHLEESGTFKEKDPCITTKDRDLIIPHRYYIVTQNYILRTTA